MRPLSLILAALALAAQSATAAPYCDALRDPDAIGKAYKRLAPIYSDDVTGWIMANDQLRHNYALKDSAVSLIAPPRPVVAAPPARAVTLPDTADFDAANASRSFHELISQINSVGAIAPNLLKMAEDGPGLAARYYFARDTHWTHEGAAQSAVALARSMAEAGWTELTPTSTKEIRLNEGQPYEEKGALSRVVTEVCGIALAPEIVPTVEFPASKGGLGLLDDAPGSTGSKIALLGTSFSNRNKRDDNRVADALAYATGLTVENYSVSGGGALSAIESYVLSGALDEGAHDILVWEMPYTTAFRSVSGLRQLLGALRGRTPGETLSETRLPETGRTRLEIPAGAAARYLVEITSKRAGAKALFKH